MSDDNGKKTPQPGRDQKGRFAKGNAFSRGSQPGDMHHVLFPWRPYWRRRALRPKDRWILPLVTAYIDQLTADKGGDRDCSVAERRVIELCAAARGCWLLALARNDPDYRAAQSFMTVESRGLSQLGLERRARDITNDLDEYLSNLSKLSEEKLVNATDEGEQGKE